MKRKSLLLSLCLLTALVSYSFPDSTRFTRLDTTQTNTALFVIDDLIDAEDALKVSQAETKIWKDKFTSEKQYSDLCDSSFKDCMGKYYILDSQFIECSDNNKRLKKHNTNLIFGLTGSAVLNIVLLALLL